MKYGLLLTVLGIALVGFVSSGSAAPRMVLVEELTNWG